MSSEVKVVGSISEGFNEGHFGWAINYCPGAILETPCLDVKSPTFFFGSSSCYVEMHEKHFSGEYYISLFLHKEDLELQYGEAVSINIIFLGMEVQIGVGDVHNYSNSKDIWLWSWRNCILKKDLLDRWTKASKKCCQLIVSIRFRNNTACNEDPLLKIRLKGKELLIQNFKDMLLDGEDHDLILKVKDKEFKAHSNIMKSRCPIFMSMLSHEMLERNSGVVDIPDCDPSAFEQFLLYIYTGELHVLDESTMLGLYHIADKYKIENLRDECCAFIKKSLSINVTCHVIKLALDHSDTALLEFATKYFVYNAIEIFETVEWMSFMKENLIQANQLIIKAVEKSSYCYVCRSK